MTYPVYWVPSPDFDRGRAHPVLAFVNHRIVGTLASADTTFTGSSRLVSSTFAVGYGCGRSGHIAGPHAHQYVYIDDTQWTNGDNKTSSGSLVASAWNAKYPTSLVNSRTITIEHHDNGHLPSGDPRKGVVPDEVADVAIYLWQTLLTGDLAAWKAAGIRWRSETAAARVAAECRAIAPGPDTVIDHHYIAGANKPYCWRPWASDAVGFPQSRYLSALEDDEMHTTETVTLLPGGPRTWRVAAGVTLNGYDAKQPGAVVKSATFASPSSALADATVYVTHDPGPGPVPRGGPFLRVTNGMFAGLLIVAALVTLDPEPPADCGDEIAAAVSAATTPLIDRIRNAQRALG